MNRSEPIPVDEPDADVVAAYLQRHPDFLAQRPELLASLYVPHQPGSGAVSLVERQVQVLREHNERLERQLSQLLQTARENERVGNSLVGLGRGLLEADSLDAVLALVRDALLNEFSADVVWIRLIDTADGRSVARDPARFLAPDAGELAPFAECLDKGRPVCGGLDHDRIAELFGVDVAELGSAAVVPLVAGRPLGVVALGSRDSRHFHPDMGTHFLAQLGELVTSGVSRHLARE